VSVPLFVELCAGTAALSVRLHGGKHARPPVSRMGAKTGYADCILRIMGLRPGQGAAHYLWCEPDDGVRLLLETYRDHELALAAADIIKGWADEEPRALWERLRAEGPVKHTGPREVARWIIGQQWTHAGRPCFASYDDVKAEGRVFTDGNGNLGHWKPQTPSKVALRVANISPMTATIYPDALQVDPQQLPPGCVVYMDPPYQGTTGYANDLPRAQVLALAMKWSQAGAAVYISEAVPLDLPGWHHIDIAGERKGQKRTFSKQQREVITCNVPPAWVPAVQGVLF
jgi:hypothetical protein